MRRIASSRAAWAGGGVYDPRGRLTPRGELVAPPFDPLVIPDLASWWDGSDVSQHVIHGTDPNALIGLNDKGPAANHATVPNALGMPIETYTYGLDAARRMPRTGPPASPLRYLVAGSTVTLGAAHTWVSVHPARPATNQAPVFATNVTPFLRQTVDQGWYSVGSAATYRYRAYVPATAPASVPNAWTVVIVRSSGGTSVIDVLHNRDGLVTIPAVRQARATIPTPVPYDATSWASFYVAGSNSFVGDSQPHGHLIAYDRAITDDEVETLLRWIGREVGGSWLAAPAAVEAQSMTAGGAITGTPTVGQTLAGALTIWSYPGLVSRQWTRDGVDIAGATGASYTLVLADSGALIRRRDDLEYMHGTASHVVGPVGPVAP